MTDDTLRDLATKLPFDRPGADRTESVRASLLAAASVPAQPSPRRWLLVGGGFTAGALAAAAIAVLVLRSSSSSSPSSHEAYARIESSSAAAVEHTLAATPSGGTDEVVRVHAGTLHLAVPSPRAGDRVRIATSDAEIEGAGEYEVVVAAEALARVTVTTGSATVRLVGKQDAVFLAAGQTWRASIQTADLTPVLPSLSPSTGVTTASGSPIETSLDGTSAAPPRTSVAAPTSTGPPGPTTARGTPIETTLDGAAGSPTAGSSVAASSSPTPRAPIAPAAKPRTATSTAPGTTTSGSPIEAELVRPSRPAVTTPSTASTPTDSGVPLETELTPPTRPAVTAPPPQLTTDVSPSRPAPTSGSEIERHFRAGWSLLRANKLADAITELGAAADAGDSPLAADARYYQAVALVKAKRGPEAERALVQFLDHAPTSIRRGRAAMMLGRLLTDRGDSKTARDWFEVAAKDPDVTVAAAAKAALDRR